MSEIELSAGTIHYREVGPADGRPVVCVHGYLMAGDLFAGLGDRLAARGLRCIMPTWPLGAHPEPMRAGADLTPRGIAATIAEFLEALGLEDVVLLGNDSGGALSQVVAVDHAERLGALVLTNCDLYDNFPPKPLGALVAIARIPGALRALLEPLRLAPARRLVFGLLAHADLDHLARGWVRPALADRRIAADLRRFTVAIDADITRDAARRLPGFDGSVLLAWAPEDRLFPIALVERLAGTLPDVRLERIAGSRTLSMIDQPDRLAGLVADFALRRTAGAAA